MHQENTLLLSLTDKIINFQDGDIFLQGEMLEDLERLNQEISPSHQYKAELTQSIQNMVSSIRQNIKTGNVDRFKQILSTEIEKVSEMTSHNTESTSSSPTEEILSNELQTETFGVGNLDNLKTYISDTEERLANAERLILELENGTDTKETINTLFRIFHTIKGECGFLGLQSFGTLSHSIESILDLLRSRKTQQIHKAVIDLLLNGIDHSKEQLARLIEGNINYTSPGLTSFLQHCEDTAAELVQKKDSSPDFENQKVISPGSDAKTPIDTEIPGFAKDSIIRIKSSTVNYLVDMTGELLIALEQIKETSPEIRQVKKITKQIQSTTMKLRTNTVKQLFSKMNRAVRDLSKKIDKKITFQTSGDDLEIDRELLESLEEPLLHLMRNSVDHGIESSPERLLKGKNEKGSIFLSAERRGNLIKFILKDDGRGLNKEKIINKAISNNIINPDTAQKLTDDEVYTLIFQNGFSTADQVTHLSGRGVGMDIVQSVVKEYRGKINIESIPDEFTEFTLTFPLNTAIMDGIVIRLDAVYCILPITTVIETQSILYSQFSRVHDNIFVFNFRGEQIPVIDLKSHIDFYIESELSIICQKHKYIGIIVEDSSLKKYCLIVDEIVSKGEIAIKSLGPFFQGLQGVSAGTILNGGKIGLVLDIDEVVSYSKPNQVIYK